MKVIYRKLGKERAWGQAHIDEPGGLIELDSTLKGAKKLEILLHEILHILNPEWSETKVIKQSKKIKKVLWNQNYRQVDNCVKH